MKAGFWAVVAIVMAGLYGMDRGLAELEAREVSFQAKDLYTRGLKEMDQGHTKAALELLTRAHYLERDTRAYKLALARAQAKAGRREDAQASLDELLEVDSNDAEANLEMARLLASHGDYGNAYSYYHRALYGNGLDHPVEVRLELARLLEQQGKHGELLAELLLLEQPAGQNPRFAPIVAHMFAKAGALDRAEQMYRALLRSQPDHHAAQVGLGEVQMARGDYRAAQTSFARARDAQKEQLAGSLAALDPTLRRLPSAEKYRRSVRVLQMTAGACRQTLAIPSVRQPTNEDAEALLDRASAMWNQTGCKSQTDDAVSLIQKRISQ